MEKEFWHKKWESNEIGFNQAQPNKLMQRYFPSLIFKPKIRVFVPLCGKSIDMIWLAGQGYQVIGVELSQSACKSFFNEHKIPFRITKTNGFLIYISDVITIFSGDFFDLKKDDLGIIDAVYDRAALIALACETRQSYALHLTDLMSPKTKMFLLTTVYDQKEMPGPPFSVNEDEIKKLYGAYFEINQLYARPFNKIPCHLRENGLVQAYEHAYLLTKL